MAKLYDRADIYDLLENEQRYQIVRRHWERVLREKQVRTLLDVSIGSGNQTLPLAELGVTLYGSDLSGEMLDRCREKAEKRGFSVDLRVSDFRRLDERFDTAFDCVASTGNSLPYVKNEEVPDVLAQMDRLVRPGGYLYLGLRNWDGVGDQTAFLRVQSILRRRREGQSGAAVGLPRGRLHDLQPALHL